MLMRFIDWLLWREREKRMRGMGDWRALEEGRARRGGGGNRRRSLCVDVFCLSFPSSFFVFRRSRTDGLPRCYRTEDRFGWVCGYAGKCVVFFLCFSSLPLPSNAFPPTLPLPEHLDLSSLLLTRSEHCTDLPSLFSFSPKQFCSPPSSLPPSNPPFASRKSHEGGRTVESCSMQYRSVRCIA